MAKPLTKKDIDNLTSKFWYSNFDRGENGCEGVPFYSAIKDELEGAHYQNYHLSRISNDIVRALCYIYKRKINHQENFDKDRCSYLYYWLGEKIYSIVHNETVFSKIIKMIYDELYKTNFLNTCPCLYKHFDLDTFNTYKILHDYSKDYGNIYLKTLSGDITCDEDYKKNIYKYINIYKDVYSNCKIEQTNKYDCKYFNELFGMYNHTDLISFHCMKRNVGKFPADEQEKVESNGLSLFLSQTSRENPVSIIYPKTQGKEGQHLNHYPHEPHDLAVRQGLGSDVSTTTDETAKSGTSKTIASSIAPVLGVSSISLLLYKVTPVGGFINKLLGRNRNVYNPIEDMDAFNPYSDEMDLPDRRMHISYHRL
ncbi:PIR protein [Plasmodium vivax]|uniref:VIR protein n=1 Tax=Plasmodium vivax TaxID=5855 RepID=A0A564ZMW8_PLAVI|nr:PIR protein [Plasmodium vivax]VUZ93026.1 PIR protein [Plasmodium vivax]